MEMLLTCRRMSAQEGERWGLINRVVPASELMPTALELAHRIAAAAPLSVRATTRCAYESLSMSVEDTFRKLNGKHWPIYDAMVASDDILEGPRAFVEKRSPRWSGH